MPRGVLFAVLGLIGVFIADGSRAQPADSLGVQPDSTQSPPVQVDRVSPSRVSPGGAAALEYLFPTLGHAYARDWGRGVPPLLVFLSGTSIAVASLVYCEDEGFGCLESGGVTAGLLVAVAGRLWGIYSAYDTAVDHNEAIPSRLSVGPARETLGLRIALDF